MNCTWERRFGDPALAGQDVVLRAVMGAVRHLTFSRTWASAYYGGGVMPGERRGALTAMEDLHPYRVRASGHPSEPVEMWSGYPLQFGGQRRFGWQDQMAADLQAALAGLAASPGDVLSGTYLSTDTSRCDVENRLFTNPGTSVFSQHRAVDPVRTRPRSAAGTPSAGRPRRRAIALLPVLPGRDMAMVGTRRAAAALAPGDAPRCR